MSSSNTKSAEEEEFIPKLESAAQEAAVADGLIPGEPNDLKAIKKPSLRRGKWTVEEESYANRLIYEFKLGLLPLTDGTTLRTFLSKLLNCDPMRISKKFVGQNCIGKQVFRRRQQDLEKLTPERIETSRRELAELERKFLERVAQTNRGKSGTNKDGKALDDDNGTPLLAPWMINPEESTSESRRGNSTAQHHDTSRNQQNFQSDASFQAIHGLPSGFPHTHNSKASSAFAGRSEISAGDYQLFNQANSAIIGQMMHASGMPAYSYFPTSYAIPHTLGNRQSEYGASDDANAHLGSTFPTTWLQQSMNQSVPYSDSRGTNGANGSIHGIGHSQDWPSMGSFFGGGGESMENIAQFLAHYQSQNVDGEPASDKTKDFEPASASKQRADDIGLSLEESSAPNSTSKTMSAVKANLFINKSGLGKWQDRLPAVDTGKSDVVPYAMPHDMGAIAQMYDSAGSHDDNRTKQTNKMDSKRGDISMVASSPDLQLGMARNSSIENFWMLVNMGDLPRPDQSVLSEVVFDYPKSQIKPAPGSSAKMSLPLIEPINNDSFNREFAGSREIPTTASNSIPSVSNFIPNPENAKVNNPTEPANLSSQPEAEEKSNDSKEVEVETPNTKKRRSSEIDAIQTEEEFGLCLEDVSARISKETVDGPNQKKVKTEKI